MIILSFMHLLVDLPDNGFHSLKELQNVVFFLAHYDVLFVFYEVFDDVVEDEFGVFLLCVHVVDIDFAILCIAITFFSLLTKPLKLPFINELLMNLKILHLLTILNPCQLQYLILILIY